jgi:hypothetical protein
MDLGAMILLSGHQVVRAIAFFVVAYFAVVLYRRRVNGARLILGGAIAVLIGDGLRAIGFLGGETGWLWTAGAFVAAFGFAFAAFGFAQLARAAIRGTK